ncbi:MAG: class I SAM-dependent methyltransferase [bacterium]
MKIITPEIVRTLIAEFSHGAGGYYNPETEIGCQRESFHDLGYGWVYFALARAFNVRNVLVVGSGRGFSAACIGLALDGEKNSGITLVDPGYAVWNVDGKVPDRACGLWCNADAAARHFRDKLGLGNVKLLPMRSDTAFETLIKMQGSFDMIVIDGDHGHEQSLADLKNALEVLGPNGILIAHDAHCAEWPGVATAIETLVLEQPQLDKITIPNHPGMAIIQRRPSTIVFRIATVKENEIINGWRSTESETVRPLSLTGYLDEDDPCPGVHYENPNVGLFSVFESNELIGGFGLRYKTFTKASLDDFHHGSGMPVSGYLRYGSVLRPDKRGRGRWIKINCMILRKLVTEGFYTITRYTEHSSLGPYTVSYVGANPPYSAFHYQLKTVERMKDNERHFREPQISDSSNIEKKLAESPCARVAPLEERVSATNNEQSALSAQHAKLQEDYSLCSARLDSLLAENEFMAGQLSELGAARNGLRSIYASRKWKLFLKVVAFVVFLQAAIAKAGTLWKKLAWKKSGIKR